MKPLQKFILVTAFGAILSFDLHGAGPFDRLSSQVTEKAPPPAKLGVGQEFVTQAGQKRKLLLNEDVALLVNQSTSGKHPAKNEIILTAGEVYVEAKNFTIKTAARQVRITKGKVAVRVDKQGTSVVVLHGEAMVPGVKKAIVAGYHLPAGAVAPVALPNNFHGLDWTKNLTNP